MATTTTSPSLCESILNGALVCEDAALLIFQYGILNATTGSTTALGILGIARATAYFTGRNTNTIRSSLLSSRFITILNITATGFTALATLIAVAFLAVSVVVKCVTAPLLGKQITWENWSRTV